MDSPLGLTLANIFLCHHETMWLKNCTKSFKPVYYKRYVDVLITRTKDTKILNFCLKLKKTTPFPFSTLRFVEKKINLQQVFSEKIRSLVYRLILAVL